MVAVSDVPRSCDAWLREFKVPWTSSAGSSEEESSQPYQPWQPRQPLQP